MFLRTDDFWRDYNDMVAQGIQFVREPKQAEYGMVAVFEDLYGNRWDLLEFVPGHPLAHSSSNEGPFRIHQGHRPSNRSDRTPS